MRRIVVLLVLLAAFCFGAAFSFHNPQPVEFNYLAGQIQAELGALLIGAVALTVVFMVAIYAVLMLPRRAELARLRRRLSKAEDELGRLRKLPLKDG